MEPVGKIPIEARIVNGNPTSASSYPFIALLKFFNPIRDENVWSCCGGSIIQLDPAVILTAAHCLDGTVFSFTDIYVDLSADLSDNGPFNPNKTNQFKAIKSLKHPSYRRLTRSYDNDIGLIYLNVNLSNYLNIFPFETVTINKDEDVDTTCCVSGDPLQVIGYGLDEEDGEHTETLEYTDLNYVDHDRCSTQMDITSNMICAWALRTDACQCDSGGPLIRTDTTEQVGIVSWGIGCATEYPGVYTRVGLYYDWIQDNIHDVTQPDTFRNAIVGSIIGIIFGGSFCLMLVVLIVLCVKKMKGKDNSTGAVHSTQTQRYIGVDTDVDTDNEQGNVTLQSTA